MLAGLAVDGGAAEARRDDPGLEVLAGLGAELLYARVARKALAHTDREGLRVPALAVHVGAGIKAVPLLFWDLCLF